jgi:hypothetical protein
MSAESIEWSERRIGAALQRTVFNREVCVVDNCLWTGFEADLLIVEPRLRIIDVEIKVTRADLKADYHKDKWLDFGHRGLQRSELPRKLWPRQVWKHYYAVPFDIWNEDLRELLGSPKSGLLVLSEKRSGKVDVSCEKRATPNKEARTLTAEEVMDIARLASLRLWNAYDAVSRAHEDNLRTRALYESSSAIK